MENDDEANEAIDALNGSDFQGRELRVDESKPKDQKQSSRGRGQGKKQSNNRGNAPATSNPEPSGGVVGFFKRLFS